MPIAVCGLPTRDTPVWNECSVVGTPGHPGVNAFCTIPILACLAVGALPGSALAAQPVAAFDAAAAFGARERVSGMTLSPDGRSVAYVAAGAGPGSAVMTLDLADGSKPQLALAATGKPERVDDCRWVSNERLVCRVYGVVTNGDKLLPFTRLVAVDRSGAHFKLLSNQNNDNTYGYLLSGGKVVDWLPDQDGMVLMSREYLPDTRIGSRMGSSREGLGVDLLDTRTLAIETVESPFPPIREYLSDGRGTIRIVGRELDKTSEGFESGVLGYRYRKRGSREWLDLGQFNEVTGAGFRPAAVDHDLDVAYGYKKKDGRTAVYSVALDGSLQEKLVYERPDVDVSGLFRIGRRGRVVGVTYATDAGRADYFDPAIAQLMKSLGRALPDRTTVSLVDSSVDEQTLLIFAGRDDDPGVYYVFDRGTRKLQTFLVARPELEGIPLARVKSIEYPGADGVMVPGYLTLPPGREDAKGLPAIVLPHGGPSARDYWGFDWLSQYYANRGYAVLQPNFRGSAGYGDRWLQENGFQSWRVAIGDILDAGHWLVSQGIAERANLAVVGWSYGGYAALQCAVTEPGLFKAVVAIAPVTDLDALKEEHRDWSDFLVVKKFVGEGAHVAEGSPARHADKIKVPVLLFHGERDLNVNVRESRRMAGRLEKAGVKSELVTWEDLDHYLEDAGARTLMLRKSDEFIRQALSIPP
jgi:dienelactone hydrolase